MTPFFLTFQISKKSVKKVVQPTQILILWVNMEQNAEAMMK
jgi:hypothetical protein